ncbi:hypothetical protein BGZ76_002953 [Entomortierella beljakovae]|nr:hypothetical protein BGZ76_002953 [Entomortierella beljakovae]
MSDNKNATTMEDVEVAQAPQHKPLMNPGPLGLCAFALTTFMSSLFNLGIGVPSGSAPGILTGVAIFYGGMGQVLAGMWEFYIGDAFSGTAFTSFGAFYLCYGSFAIPFFNNTAAYATMPEHSFDNAVGIFLLAWAFFALILFPAAARHSISLGSMIFSVCMTYLFLSISHLAHLEADNVPTKISGAFGLVVAALGWYNAAAILYNVPGSPYHLPIGLRHGQI